ncbi:MAG: hypothetical protein AAGB07_03500, partial [Pseudomonadota bacterium]
AKETFIAPVPEDRFADRAVIRFWRFADAASLRARGTSFVAAWRMSSLRSFAGIDFAQVDTAPSLQPAQTGTVRD